jgi:hypothetical protein
VFASEALRTWNTCLVFAHRFEGLLLELALGLRVNAEEVEIAGDECHDAGKGAEAKGQSHGVDGGECTQVLFPKLEFARWYGSC